jgi:hypothetical protein
MDTATTVDTSYWLTTFTCIKGAQKLLLRTGRDRTGVASVHCWELPIDVNHLEEIGLIAVTLGKLLPIPQVIEAVFLGETMQIRAEIF